MKIADVVEAVSVVSGIPAWRIEGRQCGRGLILARRAICFLARQATKSSYEEIGRTIKRDCSTVRTAAIKAANKWNNDSGLRLLITKAAQIARRS